MEALRERMQMGQLRRGSSGVRKRSFSAEGDPVAEVINTMLFPVLTLSTITNRTRGIEYVNEFIESMPTITKD